MFHLSFHFCYFEVTTRVTKPVDLPPPSKKARASAATPRSKPARPSVPWANGALATPAPTDDAPILEEAEEDEENEAKTAELGAYQQVCREGWGLSSDWLSGCTRSTNGTQHRAAYKSDSNKSFSL